MYIFEPIVPNGRKYNVLKGLAGQILPPIQQALPGRK